MVVVLILGVVKTVPVDKAVPPLATSNHVTVPTLGLALVVTVPVSHLPAGFPVIVGIEFTVATTAVRVEDIHPLNASA